MTLQSWNRLGIAAQLYMLVGVVFLPISLVLALYVRWEYTESVSALSREAFHHARQVASEAETLHNRSFALLEQLARRPAIRAMATAPCDPVFDQFLAANKDYANLLLDNAAGDVICNAAKGPNLKGLVTHRPWFKALMATGQRQVGDPTVGRVVGRWIVALAEPVRDPAGAVAGALVFTLDLWNYQFHLDKRATDARFLVTVLDSTGAVVARSRDADQWVGKKLTLPLERIRALAPGDTGFVPDAEGIEQLYGHARVAGTEWLVVVSAPRELILADLKEHLLIDGAFAAATLALLVLAAWLVAKRIRAPIETIAQAAEALGEGRFDVRLPEEAGNRELSVLAAKFNRMAELRHIAEAALAAARADLEQRVAERTAELQSANRELESFSYSVSHDLRAPLRSIDGFSQLIEERCSCHADEEAREYLKRVRSAAARMSQLIDHMLELARISRTEPARETVNLSALAREVAAELAASDPKRQVDFRIAEGVQARGDPELLRVVLQNLLENAWKYTARHASARIEFGAAPLADGRRACFVRDDGAGFDMAHADKLFGLFQRLHSPRDFEGTGVGLATVQKIVKRHGGSIWAEAAPEQGATFRFTLWER